MAVSPQLATETADSSGDAVFVFPDVPTGELWIGTITIPTAPSSAVGIIQLGGAGVGPLFGPGIYGPYIADHSRKLSISVSGLDAHVQYTAVWHADDQGRQYTTWPGTVTTTVEGTVIIPQTIGVDVVAPDPLPVSEVLAPAVESGQTTMTGAAVMVGAAAATRGVILSSPTANGHPIEVGGTGVTAGIGMVIEPGQMSPLLPVTNSSDLWAVGTSPDVLSFLVT